jgi:hypothetical protein
MVQRTLVEGPDSVVADVVPANGWNGLAVASIPGLEYRPGSLFLLDENGSPNINIDASASGTPDPIHNGTDTALWTASAASGTWDFASTTQAQAGTKSIDGTATVNGDQALIARGSTIDSDVYTSVTGYVYLTSFNNVRNEILLSFQLAGAVVGVPVDLTDFVDTATLNAWQQFTIPLSTISVTGTIDEMLVEVVSTAGQPPNFFLDTIQLEEAGAVVYTASPGVGKRYEFNIIEFFIVDAISTTLTDATMTNLSYNKILGVTQLVNGISFRLTMGGIVRFDGTFRNLGDMLFAAFEIVNSGCDGTNTFLKLRANLSDFARLEPKSNDRVELTVSDDLSGLIQFRANLRGRQLV